MAFFTMVGTTILHHRRSLFFTVRRKPNLKEKEKPVLRPGGEELAHKARGEE
jgi:hypothetical protein